MEPYNEKKRTDDYYRDMSGRTVTNRFIAATGTDEIVDNTLKVYAWDKNSCPNCGEILKIRDWESDHPIWDCNSCGMGWVDITCCEDIDDRYKLDIYRTVPLKDDISFFEQVEMRVIMFDRNVNKGDDNYGEQVEGGIRETYSRPVGICPNWHVMEAVTAPDGEIDLLCQECGCYYEYM